MSSNPFVAPPYEPRPAQLCNLPRLLDMMEQRGMDAIFSYYAPNVTYLSNYATASSAVLDELNSYCVVILSRTQPDHPILIFPDFEINYFNYQPTWIKDLRPYRSLMALADRPDTSIDIFLSEELKTKDWVLELRDKYAPNLITAAVDALKDLGLANARIGFDNLSYAPEVTKRLPGIEVVDGYRGLKWVRMIKSDSEIALMRKSQRLNQEAITRTVAAGGAGMTWFELNDAYFRNVIDLGGFVFDRGSMVLFNPKGTDPTLQISTGLETDYTLEQGTHVMFDCHGRWNRYCWDGGKTWIVDGEPQGRGKAVAEATAMAMLELMDVCRPGMKLSDLSRAARKVMAKTDREMSEKAYIFFHGVGLENSDREWGGELDWTMEKNMVISAHVASPGGPNIRHYIEEVGVVTDHGIDRFFTWDATEPLVNP
ncbi:aminopeptidase P family protein [Baekduia soli]|uniref:Aminopeptidase P family protein n=1 Tax=Baekduia soli TaxID=496014 RepID=A0A5B8U1L7_9ACTN|nr:M24 family metallopeptidase [Baekduia soli]QEC46974.1 aminopeptidase P family protein [Baekduia soli]